MPASSKRAPQGKQGSGRLFEFERRDAPLLPRPDFVRRMLASITLSLVVVGGSLGVGMLGYRHYEHMNLVDSFLNASMILSGMGPAEKMSTDAGKVFAGFYALYSGLAVLATIGLIFAPLVHRLLHRFHADDSEDSSE